MSVIIGARNEQGWTLIELLVAMTLMLVVLSATLTSFNAFSNNTSRSTRFNDQQDQIRNVLDQIIRQARNLANPTTGTGSTTTTIAHAAADRLVFQTTDPQKQWVSYCLDTSTPSREKIWYQTTSSSLTASAVENTMVTGCPAGGPWQTQGQVGDFVTNQVDSSVDRPLFSYFSKSVPPAMPVVPVPLADTSKIVRVKMSLFMKLDPQRPPAETELFSSAYMRNQNQGPTSSFVASVSGGTNYTFDAGGSTDPEGRTLVYDWYTAPASTTTVPAPLPSCSATQPVFPSGSNWACLGTTVVITKALSTAAKVFLRVTDPGNLASLSAIPGGACALAADPQRIPTNCGAIP